MPSLKKYSRLKLSRINLRDAIPLKKPFTVLFEPSSRCNFKCRFCFHNEPDIYAHLPKGRMRFEDFKKISDDLAAWEGEKIKVIRIIGFGEPLINPHTPHMVRYLKELDVAERIEITTNASLLTEAVSHELIDAGLDYIRCSIYGVDQEQHEGLTQSSIRVEKIRNNIARLRAMRDAAKASGPFIYVKMLESPDELENARFLKAYASIADEAALEKPHQWLKSDNGTGQPTRKVCPQPFKMLSIHFDGDVILCDPDWMGNTSVGNALSENISTIWGGEKMRRFWRMQLENRRRENQSCRSCSFLVDEYVMDNLEGVSPKVLEKGSLR